MRRVDCVDVVWDTYIAQSLKDEMRRVDRVDTNIAQRQKMKCAELIVWTSYGTLT